MKNSREIWSPKTRSWKQDEEGLSTVSQQRGRQHQRRLNYDPTQGNVASNIGRNLRKKRSSQYWSEQPTTLWETNTQLGTHKLDLQQIPDNLTGEEGEEKQKHIGEYFSGNDEKHHTLER